ncbi:2-isopropylmalate synthase [Botrimarina hoheduenensis]|uniref:2-isopropylmalate synthase n=1 Tax=Botrimarina hoheduenensis TaxID=2528000 RepID=A0A5C5VYT6_9BACT|nr:2-isopropylmalate synthase [Botrimarina hoheduenensis]TWT42919.1 2-isopropylmalate synthase [Botrimarina hoheduenensis]
MSQPRPITIFDTTLRDGEQSPGASMNLAEKLEMAAALADLRVDVIEAGFPIASPGDFESVRAIADAVRGVQVCGLARCNDADIDRAADALTEAEAPRIHVFLATSAIHREFKLKMDKEEIIQRAIAGVQRARNRCDNIEFSPEDAARTEPDFLCQVVEAAIAAGATTVNIPDTVGYATPTHMGRVIKTLVDRVPNIDRAVISVHCHDDLGMAVANSLAGVENGAGQIECTINGIGERAGNCSLEEVVMALRTRNDYYQATTRIDATRLVPTSRLLSSITGMEVQRNKAIVGRNAFAHESGIHQDGMLKEPTTYEIMRPEDVGFTKTDLVLGKHSGRAALADRLKALGHPVEGETLNVVFAAFKKLADKKKEIYDADLVALVEKRAGVAAGVWSLVSYEVKTHTNDVPSATVTLAQGDRQVTETFFGGDGPLDALFNAVQKITGAEVAVRDYRVHSVTRGADAQGEATIEGVAEGRLYRGHGVSTDTVEASTLAFLDAMNRALAGGGPPADLRRNAV